MIKFKSSNLIDKQLRFPKITHFYESLALGQFWRRGGGDLCTNSRVNLLNDP